MSVRFSTNTGIGSPSCASSSSDWSTSRARSAQICTAPCASSTIRRAASDPRHRLAQLSVEPPADLDRGCRCRRAHLVGAQVGHRAELGHDLHPGPLARARGEVLGGRADEHLDEAAAVVGRGPRRPSGRRSPAGAPRCGACAGPSGRRRGRRGRRSGTASRAVFRAPAASRISRSDTAWKPALAEQLLGDVEQVLPGLLAASRHRSADRRSAPASRVARESCGNLAAEISYLT